MRRGLHAVLAPALAALLVTTSTARTNAAPSSKCIAAAEAGQQLRSEGKLVSARKKFGVCTALECPVVVRRDCARWVEDLDATTPSITVRVEDGSGNEVPEATVTLDGEKLPPIAEGRSTPLDPGTHKVVWEHDGKKTEKEFVVREGERSKVIVLRAEAPKSRPGASHDPRVSPVPPAADTSSASPSPIPWVVGGGGIAATGIGIGMWLTGLGEHSDLGRTCAAAHACSDDQISSSRSKLIVGDVLVGVGVVLIAGALYFILKSDPPKSSSASAR